MNNRTIKSSIARILLAFATAAVVLGAILLAAAPPRAVLAQNAKEPASSVQHSAELGTKGEAPLAPASLNWTPTAPHPTTIGRYAFAQNGEDMYIISGHTGASIVNTLRRYNATTNVWSSLANIPVGSEAAAGAFFGGKIYVAEGISGAGNAFRIYDIATNTWSLGPPRPGVANSFGAAAGAFNGNVYVVGGGPAGGGSSVLSIYNIASNTWSTGPVAPALFSLGGYTQVGQFLYLIGSQTANAAVNSNVSMRLNMATNTWSTGPAWTARRADFALAAAGSKLYAIGGDDNGGGPFTPPSAQVDELNTSTWPAGTWTPSPDNLPSARQGNQAGFFSTGRAGGEIWSTGGRVSGGAYLDAHLFRSVLPCPDYTITDSNGTFVAAATDTGNHCDNCVTAITFPFPVSFYNTTYTSANVSSNGNLQFASANTGSGNTNLTAAGFGPTIFAFWDNLRTDAGGGIFTLVSGAAPNRVFTIEWRASNSAFSLTTRFEIRFFESSAGFEIIYGTTQGPGPGTFTGLIGAQRDSTGLFTQFAGPSEPVPASGTRLFFNTGCCVPSDPIAFTGSLGSNSNTYPGTSGTQTGRIFLDSVESVCGTAKDYPGTFDTSSRTYDAYSFPNNGPAACVTFRVNTGCVGSQFLTLVAYLGSFNPANIATNYLGDPGSSPNPTGSFSVNVPANATVFLVVAERTPGAGCPAYDVEVSGFACPLELTSAVSRKTHAAAGDFDVPLPLVGQPGVECRGTSGSHKLVISFNEFVTSGNATVTAGMGTAGSPTFVGPTMTVPLSGVTDIQKITLTLAAVTNAVGQVLPNTAVSMNVLRGDTTGNKTVNSSDIGQTKSKSGQVVNATNFRNDTTVSGSINSSDIGQVKSNSGHAVP